MKKLILHFKLLVAIMLPLIFLSSCYEIVYVSQDVDKTPNDILRPDICIQVYNLVDQPVTPYIGFLAHKSWDIKNGFVYTKDYNGTSTVAGKFKLDKQLCDQMEKIDPAPKGYYWWVAAGDTKIDANGVFHAYPLMQVGSHSGKFLVDYMIGDSQNGLNVQRSNDHMLIVVNDKSPSYVTVNNNGNSIQLKWKAPLNSHNLLGYQVLRDGFAALDKLVTDTYLEDLHVPPGKHTYTITPVYMGGSFGVKSNPVTICYSPCGTSMDFDGLDDKLVVFDNPTLRMKKTLTLEAWIKLGYTSMHEPRIISKGQAGLGYELLLTQLKDMYSLEFNLPFASLKSTRHLDRGIWYHVAAVYNGKTMELFINGQPDCMRVAYGYIANTNYPLIIGKSSMKNANYFEGDIDDVRIWDIPRTADQIFENFSSTISPEEEGLVGSWKMSEGCSVMTCDQSTKGNDAFLSGSCFCAEVYPYVQDASNQTNNALEIPVMNYKNYLTPPKVVNLVFKINPQLLNWIYCAIALPQ
jgi:hypothetical protein